MERGKKYLKLAAFIPAIVLVGAFIGCRSGAFPMFSKPEPMPEPHPLGLNMPKPPANPPAAPESKPPVFMSGTKSMKISPRTAELLNLAGEQNTPPAKPLAASPAAPNAPGP